MHSVEILSCTETQIQCATAYRKDFYEQIQIPSDIYMET